MIKHSPYIEKKQNILGIHEELTLISINVILMIFLQQEMEQDTFQKIGIVLITLAGILISIQLISTLFDNFKDIKKIFQCSQKTSKKTQMAAFNFNN